MTLAIGSRIGPYEVLSALGSGGMGEVYRAKERFRREAQVLASLGISLPHRSYYGITIV